MLSARLISSITAAALLSGAAAASKTVLAVSAQLQRASSTPPNVGGICAGALHGTSSDCERLPYWQEDLFFMLLYATSTPWSAVLESKQMLTFAVCCCVLVQQCSWGASTGRAARKLLAHLDHAVAAKLPLQLSVLPHSHTLQAAKQHSTGSVRAVLHNCSVAAAVALSKKAPQDKLAGPLQKFTIMLIYLQ